MPGVCRCGHGRLLHRRRAPTVTGLVCFFRTGQGICNCPCLEYEEVGEVEKKNQRGKFVVMWRGRDGKDRRVCRNDDYNPRFFDTFKEAKKSIKIWNVANPSAYYVAYLEPEPGEEI